MEKRYFLEAKNCPYCEFGSSSYDMRRANHEENDIPCEHSFTEAEFIGLLQANLELEATLKEQKRVARRMAAIIKKINKK